MRNQKGITLVALVITIIVLLILAGVSISLVLGNNGVLTQASEAVITNEKATIKQDMDMAFADANMDYTTKQSMGTLTDTEDLATILGAKVANNASIGTATVKSGATKGSKAVVVEYTTSTKRKYEVTIQVVTEGSNKAGTVTVGNPTNV